MNNTLYELRELVIIPQVFEEDLRLPIVVKLTNNKKELSGKDFLNMVNEISNKLMEENKKNNKRIFEPFVLDGVEIDSKWFDLDYLETFYYDKWTFDLSTDDTAEEYIQKKIDEKYKFFNLYKIIDILVDDYGFELTDISCTHEEIIF